MLFKKNSTRLIAEIVVVSLLIISVGMMVSMQSKIEEWKSKADAYALESERLLSEKLVLEKEIQKLNDEVTEIGLNN